jgi:hypothetical protein
MTLENKVSLYLKIELLFFIFIFEYKEIKVKHLYLIFNNEVV